MNPFQHHYDRCDRGTSASKYATLADGPHLVDIEPVGLCNFRCTCCPTGLGALGRPPGFMSRETYTNILRKTQAPLADIRLIGWGEPLLHPAIVDFVAQAVRAGRLTHINTNASKLTYGMAVDLVDEGLTSIKFSFQGTDRETYKTMRRIDFFDEMIEAIETMREARGNKVYPYIAASTTTTDETPEMIEGFKKRISPLVDHLGIGKTIFEFIDMASVPPKQRERLEKAAAMATVVKKHPSPCPETGDKLSIHWDGTVVTCCNSYTNAGDIGNINTDPMSKIWRHPKMEMYREHLAGNDYSLPNCVSCWDYLDLTEGTLTKGASERDHRS